MGSIFQAVVFDFNGVLADDEPIHMEAFQSVAAEEGVPVTDADYYARYLPLNDRDLFGALFKDRARDLPPDELARMIRLKSERYHRLLEKRMADDGVLFPGAASAVRAAAERFPLAIASGAERGEIDYILRSAGLETYFAAIVAAGDVEHGKPGPEPFLNACQELERAGHPIAARSKCLAIEDSTGGIRSAKSAGLRCLAVEHSFRRGHLLEADWVIPSIGELERWIGERDGQ